MNRSRGSLSSLPPPPPIPTLTSETMSFKGKGELEEYFVPKAPLSLAPQTQAGPGLGPSDCIVLNCSGRTVLSAWLRR